MKAIVLTYAPVTKEEEELLKNTDIFKVACNWHSENLKPDVRITLDRDETIKKSLDVGNQPVLSLQFDYDHPRVKRIYNLPKRLSSLISCCDYLISRGYNQILLVATNTVTNQKAISSGFQKINLDGIDSVKDYAHIYKYRDDAVFNLNTRTIEEFLTMTDENLILGTTEETSENPLLKGLVFTEAYLFKVQTIGLNNASIESGKLLAGLLPADKQQEIINGAVTIEYNGLEITRITGVEEPKEEPKQEKAPKKMSWFEMKKYVKDNNIPVVSYKKEDLEKAIWG